MIGKKTGKNCFKKFVLVANKTDFQNITSSHSLFIEQRKQKCQQQIIVPHYEKIQPICSPKNKNIPAHYIKVIEQKIVKDKYYYELDQVDLNFYKNNLYYLPEQVFVKIIVKLQKIAYKNENQINYKKIIQKCINGIYLHLNLQEKQHMIKNIYNFWRNKRKNIKSPLLRQFWIKNQFGPFKNRQNCTEGLCLRNRTVKVQDWYIREVLKQDLLILKQILKLMKLRQKSQQKLLKCQKESFQRSCKKVIKIIQQEKQYEDQDQQTISIKNLKQKKKTKKKQKNKQSKQKQVKLRRSQRSSISNHENSLQDP